MIHDIIVFAVFFAIVGIFKFLDDAHKKWHLKHPNAPKVNHFMWCMPFLAACGHTAYQAMEHFVIHVLVYSGKFSFLM